MSTIQNRIIEMEIEKSLGNEATIDRCFDTLEKAMGQKGAPIGEIRTWGGKEYIKTPKGWRAKPKGFREKKNEESHATASRSTESKVKNDLSSLSEWVVKPGSMQEKVYGKGAILPPKRNVVGESTPEHLAAQRLVRAGVLEPLGRKLNYAPAYKLTDKGKELFSQVNGTKNTPVFDGTFVNLDGSEFGLRNILDKTKGDRLLIRQTKINGGIKGIDEALIRSGWGYSTDKDENGKYEIGGPYILFYRKK